MRGRMILVPVEGWPPNGYWDVLLVLDVTGL